MSDGLPPQFPPPGQQPLPQYSPGQPPSYAGMHGAAHKPGAIPLRPLTLGAIYDGAFRIIRFNPKATVGAAVLVTALANLIPIVITAVLTTVTELPFAEFMYGDANEMEEISTSQVAGVLGIFGSIFIGAFASWIGLVFVTGMIAHVAHAAAVGRKMTLGEAWGATAGKRWRLVGLNLVLTLATMVIIVLYTLTWIILVFVGEPALLILWGVVSIPALIAGMFWFWIKVYYLPVPALMLEDVGVFGAIGRGYHLSRGRFWPVFGVALLTVVITSFASQILSTPVALVAQLLPMAVPEYGWLIFVIGNSLATVIAYAFVAPFTAAVVSLQYLDQRIRNEAHDVDLMREAGLMAR